MKMAKRIKCAWIDEEHHIIAFHPIPDSTTFEQEERKFWERVMQLVGLGYRVA